MNRRGLSYMRTDYLALTLMFSYATVLVALLGSGAAPWVFALMTLVCACVYAYCDEQYVARGYAGGCEGAQGATVSNEDEVVRQ